VDQLPVDGSRANALGPLPLIPPFQWLSSVSREWQLRKGWFASLDPRIELEYNRAQDRYLKLYQTETYTPAFTLVNLSWVRRSGAGLAGHCNARHR